MIDSAAEQQEQFAAEELALWLGTIHITKEKTTSTSFAGSERQQNIGGLPSVSGMSLMDKAEELDDYYGDDSFAESAQSMYLEV